MSKEFQKNFLQTIRESNKILRLEEEKPRNVEKEEGTKLQDVEREGEIRARNAVERGLVIENKVKK